MLKQYCGVLVISLLLVVSCVPEEPLPKIGFRDVDIDGNEVIHQVADFTFVDHSGHDYQNRKSDQSILVMNSFFTSCPTICPIMTDNLLPVFDKYSDAEDVTFVSASVDPRRDSSSRLQSFMISHDIPLDKNWHFVTGEKEELYKFMRTQLYLAALENIENIEDIEEDFIHSEKVVLVDRDRFIRGFYSGTDENDMKQLKHDINRLIKGE